MKKLNTEEFIHKAQSVHGDKYDYSKVTYVNNSTNVCIVCRDHGEFLQSPHNHLKGKGCPICGIQTNANKLRKNSEDFIREAIAKHGDKYDYSKVEYVDWKTKVCIICPEHGEFWQTPNNHLMGHGCPICKGNNISEKLKSNTDTFIQQAMEIHGDKYDYSKVEYVNNHKKVCIICPEHGEFWQTPNVHLSKRGCPICGKEKRTQKITRKFSEYGQIVYHYYLK